MDSMEMLYTFSEDGTLEVSVSGEHMPESQTMEGTYTLADDQLTIDVMGQSKTGTVTFEDNDTMSLEIDNATLKFSRQ